MGKICWRKFVLVCLFVEIREMDIKVFILKRVWRVVWSFRYKLVDWNEGLSVVRVFLCYWNEG